MRQDVGMSIARDVGKILRVTGRGTRAVARGVRTTAAGTSRSSRWVTRNVRSARSRSGVGNAGMMRLFDLHAISCAGDTLVTIGLAGTIFFNVPAGEARGRVALYLLVTMVPFALLAPVVGPLLDRFRHGRRYALAATMIGRAFLAWVIADNLFGFGLYPAAFGVLALSRAYGVARSAAVPRLLPPGLGLSQAGARASVYGTVAGAIVAPIGAAAFWFGAQWPLRVATVIFLAGVIVALALPPRADSDPPEVVPKAFQLPWRHRVENGDKILSGRLIVATLAGSACMRALYGFLLLFLAFAIRENDLPTAILGRELPEAGALALVGATLALGTFLATAIGTGLRIRRPVRLQAISLSVVAAFGAWAAVRFTLGAIVLFCLATAIASGLAKLAVDASIQERVPETVRASAFAHAETLLMLAWVAGGAFGLIPFDARVGVGVAAIGITTAAARASILARRLRGDLLRGRASSGAAAPPVSTRREYGRRSERDVGAGKVLRRSPRDTDVAHPRSGAPRSGA
jgi:MFS family permease